MSSKIVKKTVVTRRVVRRSGQVSTSTRSSEDSSQLSQVAPLLLQIIACLALLLSFTALASVHVLLRFHQTYMLPYLHTVKWTDERRQHESTYPLFRCDDQDVTTQRVEDLIVRPTLSTVDSAVDTILWHGMGVLPGVLNSSTSFDLRSFILVRNARISATENIPVIAHQNRWSFGLNTAEHPSIPTALAQLHQHALLGRVLERLLGPNPTLVELSTITSAAGAQSQYYHTDLLMDASSVRYGRSFTAMYTVLIPLQDTTYSMGATHVCPGTHRCTTHAEQVCRRAGFSVAHPTNTSAIWKAGTALLYNANARHKGGEHMGGEHRVVLIMSFVSSRHRETATTTTGGDGGVGSSQKDYVRSLPSGSVYAIRWDHWGFGWRDLRDPAKTMAPPNTVLRSLGIVRSSDDGSSTWDFIRGVCFRMQHDAFGYRLQDLQAFRRYRIGWLGKLPGLLQGRIDEQAEAPWHVYLVETARNIRLFVAVLYGVFLGMVCVVVGGSSYDDDRDKRSQLRTCALAVVVGHASVVLVAWAVLQLAAASPWGVRQADRPFEYDTISMNASSPHAMGLGAPDYRDVLLSDRLDAPDLAANGRFLEYHPGNRRWYRELRKVAPSYVSHVLRYSQDQHASLFADALVTGAVERTRTELGYSFLQQNQDGGWEELADDRVESYTRTYLLLIWLQGKVTAWPGAEFYQLGLCRDTKEKWTALCGLAAPVLIATLGASRSKTFSMRGIRPQSGKVGAFLKTVNLPFSRMFREDTFSTRRSAQKIESLPFEVGALVDVFCGEIDSRQLFPAIIDAVHDAGESYDVKLEVELLLSSRRVSKSAVRERRRHGDVQRWEGLMLPVQSRSLTTTT